MRKLITASLIIAIVVPAAGHAETYPSRPITLVVPIASGDASDVVGRALAKAKQSTLGQPVTVESARYYYRLPSEI